MEVIYSKHTFLHTLFVTLYMVFLLKVNIRWFTFLFSVVCDITFLVMLSKSAWVAAVAVSFLRST